MRLSSAIAAAALAATKTSPGGGVSRPLAVFQFTAAWCGPCRAISPVVESMASERASSAAFYKVDVDDEGVARSTADEGISAVPTFKFAKEGRVIEEATVRGADLNALKAALDELAP